MTTALEVLDTAVKIGLGAAISGIATYLVTRRAHAHELRKVRIQDATQLLRETVAKLERASTQINITDGNVSQRRREKPSITAAELHDLAEAYIAAFNDIKEARGTCILLGYDQAAAAIEAYAEQIAEHRKYQCFAGSSWAQANVDSTNPVRTELRRKALLEIAAAYRQTYA